MNSALSSLTEAYTDSENEDNHQETEHSDPEEKQIKAQIIVQPQQQQQTKNKDLPRRLVSYNDNEMHEEDFSDEEGGLDQSEDADGDESKNENPEDEDKTAKYFKQYGFHLPPEPKTKVDPKLQETITKIHQKMLENPDFNLNTFIQDKKDFRNPSIYDKLIQFCDINELGTNFPPEIFDVSIYGPESFYEELAKAQKVEMDKLEKQKKENSKSIAAAAAEAIKRKSKWDQQAPSSTTTTAVTSSTTTSTAKTIIISSSGPIKKPKI